MGGSTGKGWQNPHRELEELFKAYDTCHKEQCTVGVATCKGTFTFSPVADDSDTVLVKLEKESL